MKNNSKRALVLLASSLLLVACGGKDEVSDKGLIKEKTEITVWTTFNADYQSVIDKVIAKVQKDEPNLTINYVKQSTGYDGLKDMTVEGFATDTYPDVVVAYPDSVADFINADKALDIAPYMNNDVYGWTEEDFADVYQAYIEEGQNYTIEGTYSLPLTKSTEAMYYNHDIIGITLPGVNNGEALTEAYINSLTWDEMFNVLGPALLAYNDSLDADHKLIKATDDDWCILGYDSDSNLFITLAEQYGYGYTSIDEFGNGSIDFVNDDMKALMNKFNGYYRNRLLQTQGTHGNYTNYLFTAGNCIFTVGSTGGVGYQFSSSNPMNVGVALIPQAGGEHAKKVINQGPSLAFLDHDSDNRALASWLFYKEWTKTEYNAQWAEISGYSPIRKSVAEDDNYLEYANVSSAETAYGLASKEALLARNATYAAGVGAYLYSSPVFFGSATARTSVGSLLTTLTRP